MEVTTEIKQLAQETDTELARLYGERYEKTERLWGTEDTAKRMAGAKFYYRGKRRVTDMKIEEAETIVATEIKALQRHRANHFGAGMWVGYEGIIAPYEQDSAERTLDRLAELRDAIAELDAAIEERNAVFTEAGGWSRFFLVTSSAGHIHSSMSCSTCRPTTMYGWLPELSGSTEAAAVEKFGAALCSVCFASAPVEWQGGRITKAAAVKAAA